MTTTRVLPLSLLAVAIAHSPNTRHTLLILVEGEESRRPRYVVVDAQYRLERGGRQPSLLEAHTAWFPSSSPTKPSSVCALRCSGAADSCVYVRGRAIAVVDYFSRELCKQSAQCSGSTKGCLSDCARLILRPENPSHFRKVFCSVPYY